MNIYWYETRDGSVRHVILANKKREADKVLRVNERDIPFADFTMFGVNRNVEKLRHGGELAMLLTQAFSPSEVYPSPFIEKNPAPRPRY